MARIDPLRVATGQQRVGHLRRLGVDHAAHERHIDPLSLPGLGAMEQRSENAGDHVLAADVVGDNGSIHDGGSAVDTGGEHEPAFCLT